MINPTLQEVYNKFKHLDGLILDPRWLDGADFKYSILCELWRAIKDTMQEEKIKHDLDHNNLINCPCDYHEQLRSDVRQDTYDAGERGEDEKE